MPDFFEQKVFSYKITGSQHARVQVGICLRWILGFGGRITAKWMPPAATIWHLFRSRAFKWNILFCHFTYPQGRLRWFHQKSTCLIQLPSGPDVVQIWSHNTANFGPNETCSLYAAPHIVTCSHYLTLSADDYLCPTWSGLLKRSNLEVDSRDVWYNFVNCWSETAVNRTRAALELVTIANLLFTMTN